MAVKLGQKRLSSLYDAKVGVKAPKPVKTPIAPSKPASAVNAGGGAGSVYQAPKVSLSSVIKNGGFSVATPTARTPFSQVLPFERVFDRNLVTGLAESQINPEISRAREGSLLDFNRNLGMTGGFRFGQAAVDRQALMDAYERQRKERVANFLDTIQNSTTDWYNRQQEQYYKNPSGFVMPTLPKYDEFVTQNPGLGAAYQSGANIPVTYNNPLLF